MPWARNFCPFRAYWIISSEQVNIVLVVFFTCPNVVMDNQQETFPRRSVVHSCFHCSKPYVCMGLEEAMSPRSVVSCCKSCSSCFPCVHVASLHFPEEPCFDLRPCLPRVGPRPTWFKISLPRPASQRGIFLCHSFFSSMIVLLV